VSIRRVGVLLGKEFVHGPKNFIFIFAVIGPITISLVVSLAFGALFAGESRLGIMDEGSSRVTAAAREMDSIVVKEYDTVSSVREAVERGALDFGIVLPEGFDDAVTRGERTEITAFVWGESLAKDRTILRTTFLSLADEIAGREVPVEIEAVSLGDKVVTPWEDRILPFIVLFGVIVGGCMTSATSIVSEKERRTLEGLIVTPTSLGDVFLAKGFLGIILALVMGIVILILNQALGAGAALLVMLLGLGAVMAAQFGLILGALIRNVTSLFATIKLIGIVFYVPVLVYLFPAIPEWIGRAFPTYYIVQPIVEVSQRGGGWSDIANNVFILIGLDLVFVGVVMLVLRLKPQYAV